MSEAQEDVDVVESEVEVEESKPVLPKNSGPKALGKLAGAGIAIPTAAVVFAIAGSAGVPASTAITRSICTAAAMWLFVGLATRFLFTFVINDWRKRMLAAHDDQGVRP